METEYKETEYKETEHKEWTDDKDGGGDRNNPTFDSKVRSR